MGRKAFINDLRDAALPGRFLQVSSVANGDDDGTLKFVFQATDLPMEEIAVDAMISGTLLSMCNPGHKAPFKSTEILNKSHNFLLMVLQTSLIILPTTPIFFSLPPKMCRLLLRPLSNRCNPRLPVTAYPKCSLRFQRPSTMPCLETS
jgi:hypothetical protein